MPHLKPKTVTTLVVITLFLVLGCGLIPLSSTAEPIIPTFTPTNTPTNPDYQEFPLAGEWTGYARNGTFEMKVDISIEMACQKGARCGTFNLAEIPCSGTFTLKEEAGGVYEFTASEKQGTCGDGRDFLELLPDGKLKYTSRGDYGETVGILFPGTEAETIKKLWVVFDDDGSPDGTTALFYLLGERAVEVKSISISYGEAHPGIYIQHIGRKLDELGILNKPLGAGQDAPLAGNHEFPEWLRDASNNFWGIPILDTGRDYPVEDAAELMVSIIKQSPEPVTVFISGPSTNLAGALRLDATIKDNISAVYIMGGAVNVGGNVHDFFPDDPNTFAEWNIYSDPTAAKEVFESGLTIHLVPLDATNQVFVTKEDTRQWRKGGALGDSGADFYDMLLQNNRSMAIWDLMTAAIMVQPGLCGFQPMHLDVITEEGNNSGQTLLVMDAKPNVNVCLQPDAEAIRQAISTTFSDSQ